MRRLRAASALLILLSGGCGCREDRPAAGPGPPAPGSPGNAPESPAPGTPRARLLAAARREVARGTPYEPGYHRIEYPGGDVPSGGVCTDLVVRAIRAAGIDLQVLVHEDMRAHFSEYPQLWGLARPDPNIDHRRVPNLMAFFRRRGEWLPRGVEGEDRAAWRPGDVVFWDLGRGLRHCGIVSDRKAADGLPMAIHNLSGAAEEPCLARWPITGHARYPRESGE